MMQILNKKEIDEWIFNTVYSGGTCMSIKGWVLDEVVNLAWKNKETGDSISIVYGTTFDDGIKQWRIYLQDRRVFIDGGGTKFQSFQEGSSIYEMLVNLIKD